MTYDEKYPNAEVGQEVEPNIFKAVHLDNCSVCKKLTRFIEKDMFFKTPICSSTCKRNEEIWP